MSDLIDKVSKLLKQSEHASTEAERDVFLKKAQELATQAQISLAVARQRTEKREARAIPEERYVKIAVRGKRGNKQQVELFSSIGQANDVSITIYKGDASVNAYGFADDIDLTVALYESLVIQMKMASDAYLATGEYKKETGTEKLNMDTWQWEAKPIDGRIARHSFQDGWRNAVSLRLQEAKANAREAAIAAELDLTVEELMNASEHKSVASSTSTALALVAKEIEVREFYSAATKHIRGSWGGSRSSGHSSSAHGAGRAAGSRASFGTARAISS